MASNFVQPGNIITLTAPYARATAGLGAQVGSIFGVALNILENGAEGQFATEGVWELAKLTTDEWAQGDKVYWDNSNKRCDTDPTVGMLIGVAMEAAANPTSTGIVRLNGTAPATSEGPQAAITSLTDSGGGTADGTVALQAEPVTLTDSTGLSGSHDDTLAAVTTFTPSVAWNGSSVYPSAADATAIGAAITVLNQNASDTAQKVIELVTLASVQQDNAKEITTKIEAILVALRAAGIIAAA